MPTKVEHSSAENTPMPSRDTPPHLYDDDSTSKAVQFKFSKSLKPIEGPHNVLPENANIVEFKTDELPGLYVPHHCTETKAKDRIKEALKFGLNYIRQSTVKKEFELTRSNFKQPFLVEILEALEETVRRFRVLEWNNEVLGAAPEPGRLTRTMKLLVRMRKDYQYDILVEGSAILVPPVWGRDNNPHQWWNINDYEILCPTSLVRKK
jgi:hypothetical protein